MKTSKTVMVLIGITIAVALAVGGYFTLAKQKSSALTKADTSQQPEALEPKPTSQSAKIKPAPVQPKAPQSDVAKEASSEEEWIEKALAALEDPNEFVRLQAVASLRDHLTPESVKILTKFLDDSSDVVIAEAIDALGYIGLNSELAEEVFTALTKKAAEENYLARGQALITASMLGLDDRIMPLIEVFMNDPLGEITVFAVRAMAFIATPDCIPYLNQVAADSADTDMARNAMNIMAKINSEEASELMRTYLLSEQTEYQANSAWVLARSDNKDHHQLLSDAIADGVLGDQALAAIATSHRSADIFGDVLRRDYIEKSDLLSMIDVITGSATLTGSSTRNALADLMAELMQSSDPVIEARAVEALGQVASTKDHTGVIAEKLGSNNFLVQEKALYAYAQYCTPNTYKPLLDLYWHKNEKIRRTAFFLSSAFLNKTDKELLEKASNHEDAFIAKQSKSIMKNMFN